LPGSSQSIRRKTTAESACKGTNPKTKASASLLQDDPAVSFFFSPGF